ncbi:aminoglycoside phosphotransferase family protein [Cryobacterium sp. Y11]|uniref:aminoglycoside phosphotransferase family protein n=1 Tax=Cryobacterium sp. Y11 TaxID=2045016 RepID=UPI001304FFB6|nr:aminoglycoside phosphotransferase family protein [Cryobacterium sp. Y11]
MTIAAGTGPLPNGRATARSRAAEQDLITRDPRVAALRVVFNDDEELSAALSHPAHVTRIRYKPASSVVITYSSDSTADPHDRWGDHGWLASYVDDRKVSKSLVAARRGNAAAARVEGIQGTVHGTASADRRLAGTLARLDQACPELTAASTLLRHNPHRRLLLRTTGATDLVVKVTPRTHRASTDLQFRQIEFLDHLLSEGIPVVGLWHPGGLRDVVAGQWWGTGDLAAVQSTDAAGAAGQALAALHSLRLAPGQFAIGARIVDPALARSESVRAAGAIAVVLPEFAQRAHRLADAINDRRSASDRPSDPVLTHGDFSPDQVLVGPGEIRLVDFDRAGWSDPERDLGSFAAAAIMLRSPDLAVALFDGYAGAGGELHPDAIHDWLAHALLSRAIDPFRYRAPDWVGDVERILAAAEQVLE